MKSQLIKSSLTLAICTSFMTSLAYAASPQNVEHLPSVTLQRVTMTAFTDPKSGITFSYPSEWRESKTRDADDIVKFEGQLEGKETGEIKLVHFKSDDTKITLQFAKSALQQFLFSRLSVREKIE
jgi:hypothetical protein